MGHSSGGTLVLLAAEKGVQVRAAFSFGGTPALERELKATNGSFYIYKLLPFNWRNPDELKIREPIHFVSDIRLPTFYVEGELVTSNASGAQLMAKVAKTAHASLDVHIINGGDHFNILRPIKRLIEEKLLRDTGTTFSVTLSDAEITKAFINCRDAKPEISDKPFVRASPDVAKILKRNVTAAIQEVPREIAFIRLALTADGAVYHSVDNAFDVGDRQCESNGVTFVLDPRAYETLAPLDLSIEVTDNRKHLQVKRHVKMD